MHKPGSAGRQHLLFELLGLHNAAKEQPEIAHTYNGLSQSSGRLFIITVEVILLLARVKGWLEITVKSSFTDIRLIRTPRYYGQTFYASSLAKESP